MSIIMEFEEFIEYQLRKKISDRNKKRCECKHPEYSHTIKFGCVAYNCGCKKYKKQNNRFIIKEEKK